MLKSKDIYIYNILLIKYRGLVHLFSKVINAERLTYYVLSSRVKKEMSEIKTLKSEVVCDSYIFLVRAIVKAKT